MYLMELFEILIIIVSLGAIAVSSVYVHAMKSGPKRGAKRALADASTITKEAYLDTIHDLKDQLASYRGKYNRAVQMLNERDGLEEEENDKVTYEQIKEIASKEGIPSIALDVPMVKELIEPMIKGKSADEVIKTIQQLKPLYEQFAKGRKPQTGTTEDYTDIKEWA